jgi:hypothetical protein
MTKILGELQTDLEARELDRCVNFDVCAHRGDSALETFADELVTTFVKIISAERSLCFIRNPERFDKISGHRVVNAVQLAVP